MALTREKIASSIGDLKEAIHGTAMKGKLDRRGMLNGTGKIPGYVCAIHGDDDENEELRGTVDVQEYNYMAEEVEGQAAGFHEGVLLSAIADNQNGYRIIPCLFSEVIIAKDPYTLEEYVVMYSHASIVEMKVHDQIDLNVTEYKDFKETDDGLEKDYNELEETGNKSSEKHTATEITNEVIDKDENKSSESRTSSQIVKEVGKGDESNKDEMVADKRTFTVGDTTITFDKTTITIQTSKDVTIKSDDTVNVQAKTANIKADSEVTIDTKTANVKGTNVTVKGSKVSITGGQLTTKGISNTDLNGPFNAIKMCPFSGAPHCGSQVSGT